MLRPLRDEDFPAAALLLTEGFPDRTLAFWQHGLQCMRRYAQNEAAGLPLGHALMDGDIMVGVVLTPASPRARPDGSAYVLVNVSSWYVKPEFRWRAGMMLRTVLANQQHVYVDITPNEEVCRMLPLFGFRPVNTGLTVALLPWLALRRSHGARVRPLRSDDSLPPEAPPMETLLRHRELACEPLMLEHSQGQELIVYRRRTYRRMPAARLKYIGSHATLVRHLPALARYLLLRGMPFLTFDSRADTPAGLPLIQVPGRKWYVRGQADFSDHTDFVGTELCILGL
jgi:hypothetical protein